MGKVVDSYHLVPDGSMCRPIPIDTRDQFPNGGWRVVSWAYRIKESWVDFQGLSGREALGKWEIDD